MDAREVDVGDHPRPVGDGRARPTRALPRPARRRARGRARPAHGAPRTARRRAPGRQPRSAPAGFRAPPRAPGRSARSGRARPGGGRARAGRCRRSRRRFRPRSAAPSAACSRLHPLDLRARAIAAARPRARSRGRSSGCFRCASCPRRTARRSAWPSRRGRRGCPSSGRRAATGPTTTARCGSHRITRAPMLISLSTKNRRLSNIFSKMRISPFACVATISAMEVRSAGKAGHGPSSILGICAPRSLRITSSCPGGTRMLELVDLDVDAQPLERGQDRDEIVRPALVDGDVAAR